MGRNGHGDGNVKEAVFLLSGFVYDFSVQSRACKTGIGRSGILLSVLYIYRHLHLHVQLRIRSPSESSKHESFTLLISIVHKCLLRVTATK